MTDLGPEHAQHLPGECRRCWVPCRNEVPEGTGHHCPECLSVLAVHPNPAVRTALAKEPDVPTDILELLSTDLQASVQMAASDALAERDNEQVETFDLDW